MSNYVTAIGLDVHARSIKACALNPMTGEVERASFGYDPASVAEWALSFESPKAVYESGVTGFHLCRALRALGLDCAVGAVSKMQRPPPGPWLATPYLMTPSQVAAFTQTTPAGVRKLLSSGRLKGSRMGSRWVIPKFCLLRYLNGAG